MSDDRNRVKTGGGHGGPDEIIGRVGGLAGGARAGGDGRIPLLEHGQERFLGRSMSYPKAQGGRPRCPEIGERGGARDGRGGSRPEAPGGSTQSQEQEDGLKPP